MNRMCTVSLWLASLSLAGAALAGAAAPPAPLHVIALDMQGGSVWLPVRVNGSGPLRFLLDSAAARSVVDRQTAEKLGLRIIELGQQVVGSAEAAVRAAASPNVEFDAGGARWTSHAGVVPLDVPSSSIGRRYDGVLGYDLMSAFVVEVDYAAGRMSLYDPEKYEYAGKGHILPIRLQQNAAYARMRLGVPGGEPIETEMMIDSGGPGMTVLAAPFVERHGLIAAARKLTPNLVEHPGVGVGGTNRRLVGRLPFLEIGPYRIERPLAGFSQAGSGAYARTDIAGTIGGSTLRRFKVIYDYKRQRVILEPNSHYADPPEAYDMSGLLLRARGSDLREFFVYKVIANSPASEAGIQEGDVFAAIDGKPLDGELSEVTRRLKQPGAKLSVSIERNGQRREFRLALRPLL
jgi:hypothetical protein